jgi:predicted nucleic acid-binding Zn ribbon protein
MGDVRYCEQCGAVFEPRREHERFCSARCRIAWNRENTRGPQTGNTALDWSVTAMCEAVQRLGGALAPDMPQGLAVISEAVWWVTIVDATMIRYHGVIYDRALRLLDPGSRRATEGIFAGLRFVRNQMGYYTDPGSFITRRLVGSGVPGARVAAWTWDTIRSPVLNPAPATRKGWEISRHRQYQAHLAGHTVGETIEWAAAFLTRLHQTASQATEPRTLTTP